MAKVTDEQLSQLQEMVKALVADKGDADAKTQASNQADTEAATATALAAQAKLQEAEADARASADLQALMHFIDGLASE